MLKTKESGNAFIETEGSGVTVFMEVNDEGCEVYAGAERYV
jgi:hypothetical protein